MVTATIVRLFTISAINAYATSWALALIGTSDYRMLLPAWIFVAFILSVSYYASLRNMRAASPALYLLCLVSFCSMCILLYESHVCTSIC
ncbi:hypothetical protein EDC01DRAFT_407418 [Geopyxis carbonaria]|nr:hypothetical protein EDC01DRAFT_407418 [Geopyxis carbonaria]